VHAFFYLVFTNFLREIELMMHIGAKGANCRITTNILCGWMGKDLSYYWVASTAFMSTLMY
jgi:hypothetical protein